MENTLTTQNTKKSSEINLLFTSVRVKGEVVVRGLAFVPTDNFAA